MTLLRLVLFAAGLIAYALRRLRLPHGRPNRTLLRRLEDMTHER